jgi:hypothetical protein
MTAYVPIVNVEWYSQSDFYEACYDVLAILSVGTIPIAHIFYPQSKVRMKCLKNAPQYSDYVVVTFENFKIEVANIIFYDFEKEQIVTFEIGGQRFYASNLDDWEVTVVPDVPYNFKRFLGDSSDSKYGDSREVLAALYGPNEMLVPIPPTYEVVIRHALHPLICFGYFAAIIWYIQDYVLWGTFAVVAVVVAVIAMTQVRNLYPFSCGNN